MTKSELIAELTAKIEAFGGEDVEGYFLFYNNNNTVFCSSDGSWNRGELMVCVEHIGIHSRKIFEEEP